MHGGNYTYHLLQHVRRPSAKLAATDHGSNPTVRTPASSRWLSLSCQSTNKRIKREVNCNEVGSITNTHNLKNKKSQTERRAGILVNTLTSEGEQWRKQTRRRVHALLFCILPETLPSTLSDLSRVENYVSDLKISLFHFCPPPYEFCSTLLVPLRSVFSEWRLRCARINTCRSSCGVRYFIGF
jgi:hypothetical protein